MEGLLLWVLKSHDSGVENTFKTNKYGRKGQECHRLPKISWL